MSTVQQHTHTFKVESFGCQMNTADATEVKQVLRDKGFLEDESDSPDIVIINSCAIRETAEDRVYGRLKHYTQLKARKPLTLILMGCLAQKDKEDVLARVSQVDLVIGTHQKYHIAEIIHAHLNNKSQSSRVYDTLGYQFNASVRSDKFSFKADITIIHGCNKHCSYCIVPFTRGQEISRPSQDIIENAKHLADEGVTELLLLGQNVNSYGQDSGDICFATLLEKLNCIEGLRRIRFLTSHPIDFDMNLIDVIAESPRVCKYIHLPLQSASNPILQRMKREYTYEHYYTIIQAIREKIPGAVLSTDIIVGFPGESEEDFERTYNAMRDIRYDTAFMFQYSPRAGTPATEYSDQVSTDEKKRRLALIIDMQARIRKEINEAALGSVEEILLESPSKNNANEMLGKTDGNKAVVVPGGNHERGRYITVKLSGLSGNTFQGHRI